MGAKKPTPSFQFNDQQAAALQAQNQSQLNQYQLERQKLLSGSNAQTADYFNRVNSVANDQFLQNMGSYTNALGGYQNSLNQNTADANNLLGQQNQYYTNLLSGQQEYQNAFAGLLSSQNQQQAAQNAAYQQEYLSKLGAYNQDNTAQQQQFMQQYLGQMGQNSQALQASQQGYQQRYQQQQEGFNRLKQNTAANQAQLNQQAQNKGLMSFLQQYGNTQARGAGARLSENQIQKKMYQRT